MKHDIPVEQAHRLLSAGPVCLLTSSYKGRVNVMTVGWTSSISYRPVLVAAAIFQGSLTHDLVQQSGEFVLNIPSRDLMRQVQYCGTVSGRDADKMTAMGLREDEPGYVRAPLIMECIAHLECVVTDRITPGDHTMYIAEVVAAKAEADAFDVTWLLKERDLQPLHHLGLDRYAVLEPASEKSPDADRRE
jgi:flavin reductase (DIM6/NTAB) family NADH-FMN oxidoreductase RutF